nr:MAG TPA: hypothetical protein [Caudoviricetes sp.]
MLPPPSECKGELSDMLLLLLYDSILSQEERP